MNVKHKMTSTRIYRIWANMKQRCLDPKRENYARYGGRGVTVCNEWMDFKNFFADMGSTYKEGLSIERIDNDKGYCKDNCKWIVKTEQNLNTRKIIRCPGDMSLSEYCRRHKLPYGTILTRIRNGWQLDTALKTPIRPMRRV